jgi:hypothetical protein
MDVMLSFTRNFEAEVHLQYQQMGSKLRNTVRSKNDVRGMETSFQPLGTSRQPVACVLQDFYAGDWIDNLDELRTNVSEQQIVAKCGAFALGRKTDDLIIAEFSSGTNFAGSDTDELTKAKIHTAFEMLGVADVPDDLQCFAVVGWKQWSDLLNIKEFAEADYVDQDDLPWKGTQAKRWLGSLWIPHSGLPKSNNARKCFWYHKTAVGHAIGAEVKTEFTWHGDRAAHFVNNVMSQGACLIDPTRVVTMRCKE